MNMRITHEVTVVKHRTTRDKSSDKIQTKSEGYHSVILTCASCLGYLKLDQIPEATLALQKNPRYLIKPIVLSFSGDQI